MGPRLTLTPPDTSAASGRSRGRAVDLLEQRPDVDSGRIGGLGLSVGDELMLQAAAEYLDGLDAVVSEGADTRTFAEDLVGYDTSAIVRGFHSLVAKQIGTRADAVGAARHGSRVPEAALWVGVGHTTRMAGGSSPT